MNNEQYNAMSLDLLCDHIEQTHHKYVENTSVEIKENLKQLIDNGADNKSNLIEVSTIFDETASQLAMHMRREELMLFPVIRKMVKTQKPVKTLFGSIRKPIETMLDEHDSEEERFEKIAELTDDYNTDNNNDKLYNTTLKMLKEFGEDLLLHIHLENDILFPKSIELEDNLKKEE